MIFVDSFYLFAMLNPSDDSHSAALEFSASNNQPLLTTTWVLTEVADGLTSRQGVLLREILTQFREDSENLIVEPTLELFEQGVDLFVRRPDKDWSLTDCISFVVMRQYGVLTALTGDHHFEQAGFTIVFH